MPNLVGLTLNRPGAANSAVYGNFSGARHHELVLAKGTNIDLLRPDESGKLVSLCHMNCFCIVRSLMAFRLLGSNKDYLVVGTDSGKVTVMEFIVAYGQGSWTTLHCETFGKTGCRRIVPGQYLAADPHGRAIMVSAIEKQHFVYVMNRDGDNKLTISSPLEAHKGEIILYSCVGLDVGLENPMFALLELDYSDVDADPTGEAAKEAEKLLTFYELDLGLNHVVRKWCEPVSRLANFLLAVPGGDSGPGGVLVCGENWISYKNQNHPEVRTALPRRIDMPATRGLLPISGALHKQKGLFFFLVQTEYGDIYKITLDISDVQGQKTVRNVLVSVFDTVQPANSLCITRSGLLFVASEHCNHNLYQFASLGDDEDTIRAESCLDDNVGDDAEETAAVALLFKPSTKLKNLVVLDELSSLAPITDLLIEGVDSQAVVARSGVQEQSQGLRIQALCGKGNRSSLRVLQHGSSVTEIARSDLPGKPTAVWTVKLKNEDTHDAYIVVSFTNATIVLSIGDTVEEVTKSGFLLTSRTLGVALLDDDSLLQVHASGIRHIRADSRVVEWKTPGQRPMVKAVVNSRQVVIAIDGPNKASGGCATELIYFELDAAGQLTEEGTLELDVEVCSIDVGDVPEGRAKFPFLAVGQVDDTVSVLSLERGEMLQQRAVMQVPSRPDDLKYMQPVTSSGAADSLLSLNVGLQNGVLVRVAIDAVTGTLSDSRQRFLGAKSLKLCRVEVGGHKGLLALSSKNWIMYNLNGSFYQAPIAYDALDEAHSFNSESCPGGAIAVSGRSLRIFSVDDLGTVFSQQVVPLSYTPRKMERVVGSRLLVIIESDQHEYNDKERELLGSDDMDTSMNTAGDGTEEEADEETQGPPLRGPIPELDGKWASCIRVLDTSNGITLHRLELQENQAALSLCTCTFPAHSTEVFVAVGVTTGLLLHPRSASGSNFVHIYRFVEGGRLSLVHATQVEAVPLCVSAFQGRLLVGMGRVLRLYDLGMKQLLRKCESSPLPVAVARLATCGDRIFAGDVAESVLFMRYKKQENHLCIFAEDDVPRFISNLCALDYDTVAASDKFGNFMILRVPEDVDDGIDTSASRRSLWDASKRAKVSLEALFYVGDTITCIKKSALSAGGKEVLLAATVSGGLHAFVPCSHKAEYDFYESLQGLMRREGTSPCGRDHRAFRSFHAPTCKTVDGDLCEGFQMLTFDKQLVVAQELEMSPVEINRKLEELRNIL